MAWIAPKLDWALLDENGNTTTINYGDFNRIENNIQEVATYLNSIQYPIPAMTINTSRDNTSIDYISSINRIEQNIETIRTNFIAPLGYLPAETWVVGKGFDYTDANRLEGNINILLSLGVLVYQSYRRCGTFLCGESGGLE